MDQLIGSILTCLHCGLTFEKLSEAKQHMKHCGNQRRQDMRFSGKTEDAGGPILGAGFWKKGTKLSAVVMSTFETENGLCYNLKLPQAITVNGTKTDKVSIGAMAGFEMALQAAGIPDKKLLVRDMIVIECTGSTETHKGNPRVNFTIDVDRP